MTAQLTAEAATVATAMTRYPLTVAPHTPIKRVVELLAGEVVAAVAVVSATGLVVGEVSEADLLRYRNRADRGRVTAAEVMRPVTAISPTTPLTQAVRMLIDRVQLCVVEDGRMVGVLTRRDVLSDFRRQDKEIQVDIEARIADSVHVGVRDGVVLLTGWVPRRADQDAARALAAGTPGVIDVRNRIVAEMRN